MDKILKLMHKETGTKLGEITLVDGISPSDFQKCIVANTATVEINDVAVELSNEKVVLVDQPKRNSNSNNRK